MKRTEVSIPCGDITLEGIWQIPDGEGNFPAVIICHPHPLHGGSIHNYIVSAVSRALLARSIATLRFNFRGVGKSGGAFGDGIKEQDDVKAAVDFAISQKNVDKGRIGMAGYSFGGGVSVPAAFKDSRVKALALISPAIMDGGWDLLRKLKIPKMLISGSGDAFFPTQQFEAEFKGVPAPKQIYIIEGADHFWQGFEAEVGEKVGECFKVNL